MKAKHIKWGAIFALLPIAFLFYGMIVFGGQKYEGSTQNCFTDGILINGLAAFGKLERPEVLFLHDKHTDALEKKNKDCLTCHVKDKNNNLSIKFKRIENVSKDEVMDIYHLNCINCHNEMSASGDKSGPVTCGECHRDKVEESLCRAPIEIDKSLHGRHSKAYENKCETCHHEYNPETKKLFYEKGKESSCRYCHKDKTEENRMSMSMAAHTQCVNCHKKNIEEQKTAGPIKCSGCHDAKKQQLISKLDTIPRLERKQPDAALIKNNSPELATRMNFVPFDHKAHEEYNDTCRVCHHESLNECTKCHTLLGIKEGSNVSLESSMHTKKEKSSCIGCHEAKQKDKQCIGCHTFDSSRKKSSEDYCAKCHMSVPAQGTFTEEKDMSNFLLISRKLTTDSYNAEEIPEKVVMKDLVDKYEQAEMPHRKIVEYFEKSINSNKLSGYFHKDKNTVCNGCHHNSTSSVKPTRCGNCHGKPLAESENLDKPVLMTAYHGLCIGCHKEMELGKATGCADCHKERKKWWNNSVNR
ncbi:MAG: cytochrome C [Desulfobacterales bacterium]|nr:cytochrome C [Desulfobacterales bacterium]